MANRLQEDYLRDIIEHVAHITNFVEGVSYTEFLRNVEKIFAVIRALEIIGEQPITLLRNFAPAILQYPGRK